MTSFELSRPTSARQPLHLEPPPVGAHGEAGGRVGDDRRRPLDGVDLGQQRGVDQARLVEQVVVGPGRDTRRASRSQMALCSSVNRVCSRLRPIHQLPLTPVRSMPLSSSGSRLSGPMVSLPPCPERSLGEHVGAAAVELRARPTSAWRCWRRSADSRRRPGGRVGSARVRRMRIGFSGQSSSGGSGTCHGLSFVVAAVAEPVVDHELEPGGGEQVERRGRLERVAREQLAADEARIGRHDPLGRLLVGALDRHVAAEAGAGAAHCAGGARSLYEPSGVRAVR